MKRYQFIDEHCGRYDIALLTESLAVSRAGFYDWQDRPASSRAMRSEHLAEQVRGIHDEYHGIYGSRKVAQELIARDVRVCRNTVAKLMSRQHLHSRAQKHRRFTVTTDSNHLQPIASNVLERDFSASGPNEKWVADITYVSTEEGFAYMAAVMDLYSRRIIGWSVSDTLETSLVLDALTQAIETRRPSGQGGLVHHSDRGCQYASSDYRELLTEHGIECSMSRRGDCWDNAPMERFMNAYKNEWMEHERFATVEDVHRSTFKYIEVFYNRRRRHQALGYISPIEFETLHHTRGADAA